LKEIHDSLSATEMKRKLELYEPKLLQLPAIVAGYLNPQIPKPSDPAKLSKLKETIRTLLNEKYSDKLEAVSSHPVQSDTTLFEALFASVSNSTAADPDAPGGVPLPASDEVERYLAMGVVQSKSFIDVIQWWIARKDVLPAHFQMAMDYLGTPATSTPSERVNSMAGREFTSARQSLSSEIFVKTMCLRSWMKAQVIKIPSDRQKAMMMGLTIQNQHGLPGGVSINTAKSIDVVVSLIEIEQDDWAEEVLDDGIVGMLNIQFDNLIADESDLSCL
jgi:hypothetical protein